MISKCQRVLLSWQKKQWREVVLVQQATAAEARSGGGVLITVAHEKLPDVDFPHNQKYRLCRADFGLKEIAKKGLD